MPGVPGIGYLHPTSLQSLVEGYSVGGQGKPSIEEIQTLAFRSQGLEIILEFLTPGAKIEAETP